MVISKLDPREEHFNIPSSRAGLSLFLRRLTPSGPAKDSGIVLYVHGGTFPSGLSIAHRFDGRSWRDSLCEAGFTVWGLDFHGFGRLSDPYPEMDRPPEDIPPLGRAEDASRQLGAAIRFILQTESSPRLSLVAHSWGSIVAGLFAGRYPALLERMVFFGAIPQREGDAAAERLPGWRLISVEDQWKRFTEDVPAGEPAVLERRHFDPWAEAYLDIDPDSRRRDPPAVKTPSGAFQDIYDALAGDLAYDPALIKTPLAILRGAWDHLCTDQDAAWFMRSLTACPWRREVSIPRATHLVHLEENREILYRETEAFLLDRAPRFSDFRGEDPCSP